jgi:hypothetical protein
MVWSQRSIHAITIAIFHVKGRSNFLEIEDPKPSKFFWLALSSRNLVTSRSKKKILILSIL